MTLHEKAAALRARQPTFKENGDRLATIKRPDGDELRLHWSAYEGRNYLNIQVWSGGYPVKDKRITVGLAALPEFAEGVEAALDKAINDDVKVSPSAAPTNGMHDDSLDDILPLN